MGEIIINPGTAPIKEEVSYEDALINMQLFIHELDIPYKILQSKHVPDSDGYFEFVIKCDFYKEIKVYMPGLHPNKVRFRRGAGLNANDFQRLYIENMGSWLWCFAIDILNKEGVIELINSDIESLECDLTELKEILDDIQNYK